MAAVTHHRNGSLRGAPRRTVGGLVLLLAAATSGCLGESAPDPSVQPLEIVVGSSTEPDDPCLLNVAEVGAGTHEVFVISESGPATVRILDPSGAVLLEQEAESGETIAETGSVDLEAGTHRVECVPSSGPASETDLRVTPPASRPGY